ncbi:MAG: enoyl-CoA hydratase/isomerase family protein, partial [Alphaproteobacteria bacterium]|nr:enoyl-CoA hydratase/isomerase family protein [Alphaproteobacteria bacterium]
MPKHITVSTEDRVAVVSLNRPEVHNAFNAAMIAEVTEAFGTLAGDAALLAVVLEGAGPSFCAGGDLN